MGKKRVTTASGGDEKQPEPKAEKNAGTRKRLTGGVLYIQSTYNNTKMSLTDPRGDTVVWSSSGALGFTGTKRGTPFAASRVAELMFDRAAALGLKEAEVVVKGVGPGREAALRALVAKGLVISSIKDATPIPFNGPKSPRPRRV